MKTVVIAKKVILSSLLACVVLVGLPSLAKAAGTSAGGSAYVVIPLTSTEIQPLSFGRVSATANGTVTVGTNGARTATGGAVLVSSGSTNQQGQIKVMGELNYAYGVELGATAISLSGSNGGTANVGDFNILRNATLSTADGENRGADTFDVGGTLTVTLGQTTGTYTGSLPMTIQYE